MKISILFTVSLLSILLLAGCSSKDSHYSNILSGSFKKDSIHAVAEAPRTLNGSIKKIANTQPQETATKITQQITKQTILTKLVEIGAGVVSECEHKSDLYFSVDFNNLNMSTKIIDQRGNIFATCDYQDESKKKLAPICDDLQRCKLVYVSENNVRGYNYVDKYGINPTITD
ncbi:MAG: hypothetical protein WAZ12_01365 [Candidatus Absconditicoccaceae bacterium]